MKRLILLTLCLAFVFASCTNDELETTNDEANQEIYQTGHGESGDPDPDPDADEEEVGG